MEEQTIGLVNDFINKLNSARPDEGIALLKKIENLGKDMVGTAGKLLPFLEHPNYLVRSRVFIALGRLKDRQISSPLLDYLEENPEEEWQIRVLECLYLLKDSSVVPRLSVLLTKHHQPIVVRGVTWLIGYLGGKEAAEILLKFAASPQGRMVKSDILYEGISLAVQSLGNADDFCREFLRENPAIARFFLYSQLPEVEQPRFSVFPYPDYLLDQAKVQGIKAKEFKRLYYREQGDFFRH